MLEHGGNIQAASIAYGISPENWIDLSTGINPQGWQVPPPPGRSWHFLPDQEQNLIDAGRSYYGAKDILPVAGSQAVIQVLPSLRCRSKVAVLSPGYSEHRHAWLKKGHMVACLAAGDIDNVIDQLDVLVVSNPNNPTGYQFPADKLLHWHRQLSGAGGWLVVDEAFIDATPGKSIIADACQPGLIVLRSLGKFFGLAGARVGFVAASAELLCRMQEELGPWTITGPSLWAATLALKDKIWQARAINNLRDGSLRLAKLLAQSGFTPAGGTMFFQWVVSEHAHDLHKFLAERAILTRYFAQPQSVRFGLPSRQADWQKLEQQLLSFADQFAEGMLQTSNSTI